MEQSRRNMFDVGRWDGTIHLKVGFTDDGVLTAVEGNATEGVGQGAWGTRLVLNAVRMTNCKNIKNVTRSYYSNTLKLSVNRGYRWSMGIMNTVLEAVSAELGMDILDVIWKNSLTTEPSLKALLEKSRPLFDWNWHPTNSKKLLNGKMHGISALVQAQPRSGSRGGHWMNPNMCMYFNNWTEPGGALGDGKIYIPFSVPDYGLGQLEGIAMVVAEELGAKYEDVIPKYAVYDTPLPCSPAMGSIFSDTAYAAKECALNLKQYILESASRQLSWRKPVEIKPEELDIEDSEVYVKADPAKRIAFKNLDIYNLVVSFSGYPDDHGEFTPHAHEAKGGKYSSVDFVYTFGEDRNPLQTQNIMMCEVEVDTETGQVEIKKLLGVTDPGKCIRPTSYNNQAEGLLDWTIATNMYEDFVFDKETGVLLNCNDALEYKIPTRLECNMKEHDYVETRCAFGGYGSTGISEFFHSYVMVALAVHNAIGKWVNCPLTPDKILAALGKA